MVFSSCLVQPWRDAFDLPAPKIRVLSSDDRWLQRQLSCGLDLLSRHCQLFAVRQERLLSAAMLLAPDLILLSAYDPNLNGFEACQCLRRIESLARTPIALLLQEGDAMFHSLAKRCGCDLVIEAPIGGLRMMEELQSRLAKRLFSVGWRPLGLTHSTRTQPARRPS
jgi:PleD family two-component response regulator